MVDQKQDSAASSRRGGKIVGESSPLVSNCHLKSPVAMPGKFTITKCDVIDAQAVVDILSEAATWLQQIKQPMWKPEEFSLSHLTSEIQQGLFELAKVNDVPAGVMKYQTEDPIVWPQLRDDNSAFVHRLAVRRCFAGQGVSSALLKFAVDKAIASGKSWLRLDCDAERKKLRDVYEKSGFTLHSICQVGPYKTARYELSLKDAVSAGFKIV